MTIVAVNQTIEAESLFGKDNVMIAKKFNSMVRLLKRKKNLILESGCVNCKITKIEFVEKSELGKIFNDYEIWITENTYNNSICISKENFKNVSLNHKYGVISVW